MSAALSWQDEISVAYTKDTYQRNEKDDGSEIELVTLHRCGPTKVQGITVFGSRAEGWNDWRKRRSIYVRVWYDPEVI